MASLTGTALPPALQPTGTPPFHDGEPDHGMPAATANPRVISYIRDDWIHRQMVEREAEFTAFRTTSVFVGTFNANGKKPQNVTAGVAAWLRGGGGGGAAPRPLADLYVVGFQEIVDLNAANVLADGQSASRTAAWAELIHDTLNSLADRAAGGSGDTTFGGASRVGRTGTSGSIGGGAGGSLATFRASDAEDGGAADAAQEGEDRAHVGAYHLVAKKNLVGIAIMVFVKAAHATYVQDVQGQSAGVGLMGMMGNKGACAVRMQFYDSTLCFVSAHMAAHRGNVQGRNADYANILDKVAFKDHGYENMGGDGDAASPSGVVGGANAIPEVHNLGNTSGRLGVSGIRDHDFVFWLGDLNYRIQSDIPTEECYRRINQGDLEFLRQHDQLNQERAAGRCFDGFEEGFIGFRPTYKYIPGTDRYDDREDKKMRAPAWCDRVLWSCRAGNQSVVRVNPSDTADGTAAAKGTDGSPAQQAKLVELKQYGRNDLIKISDHKPVLALFDVQLKTTVRHRQRKVYEEIMRGGWLFSFRVEVS